MVPAATPVPYIELLVLDSLYYCTGRDVRARGACVCVCPWLPDAAVCGPVARRRLLCVPVAMCVCWCVCVRVCVCVLLEATAQQAVPCAALPPSVD
jgi:hypothetical protein